MPLLSRPEATGEECPFPLVHERERYRPSGCLAALPPQGDHLRDGATSTEGRRAGASPSRGSEDLRLGDTVVRRASTFTRPTPFILTGHEPGNRRTVGSFPRCEHREVSSNRIRRLSSLHNPAPSGLPRLAPVRPEPEPRAFGGTAKAASSTAESSAPSGHRCRPPEGGQHTAHLPRSFPKRTPVEATSWLLRRGRPWAGPRATPKGGTTCQARDLSQGGPCEAHRTGSRRRCSREGKTLAKERPDRTTPLGRTLRAASEGPREGNLGRRSRKPPCGDPGQGEVPKGDSRQGARRGAVHGEAPGGVTPKDNPGRGGPEPRAVPKGCSGREPPEERPAGSVRRKASRRIARLRLDRLLHVNEGRTGSPSDPVRSRCRHRGRDVARSESGKPGTLDVPRPPARRPEVALGTAVGYKAVVGPTLGSGANTDASHRGPAARSLRSMQPAPRRPVQRRERELADCSRSAWPGPVARVRTAAGRSHASHVEYRGPRHAGRVLPHRRVWAALRASRSLRLDGSDRRFASSLAWWCARLVSSCRRVAALARARLAASDDAETNPRSPSIPGPPPALRTSRRVGKPVAPSLVPAPESAG